MTFIELDEYEQDAFLDVFYEAFGYNANIDTAQRAINNIPHYLYVEAEQWGFTDTVIADNLLNYWKSRSEE